VLGVVALFVLPLPFLSASQLGDALQLAFLLTLKAIALTTLAAILGITATMETNLAAARALWLPGLLVQLGLLSWRYLFVLADELQRLRIALRTRGFRNRADAHSYSTIAAAGGNLLVRGWDRAERVAAAMRCRGFDGQYRSLTQFTTCSANIILFLSVFVLAGLIVGLDRWFLMASGGAV
jgi:cobalt/nickel transport system permease protein